MTVETLPHAAAAAPMPPSDARRLDAEAVRRIVLRHRGRADAELTVSGPVAASEFSMVFRGEGTAYTTPVAINLFFPQRFDKAASKAARSYYTGLAELRELAAGDPDLGVAKPLDFIGAHDIVITEWIAGPTLRRAMLTASSSDAVRAVAKAGAWLARLQCATLAARKPVDTDSSLGYLQRSMDANPRIAGGKAVQRATRLLQRTAGRLGDEEVNWCRAHGDFKPRNLILRDRGLFGIDLELRHRVSCVHDAAHFLNHLQLAFMSPASLYRLRAIPALTQAFREGYAKAGQIALPARPLAWERLRNAVHLLVRHREWTSPPRSWGTNLQLRWLVYQLARDLLSRRFDEAG
jgi:aminoglycoside phosphotransferase (APT) family kinase protein